VLDGFGKEREMRVEQKSSLEKKFDLIESRNLEVPGRFGDGGRVGVVIEGLKLDTSTQIWPENLGTSEKSQKPASFGNISCQVSLNMYNDEMHM
jgi:hypothetical protein